MSDILWFGLVILLVWLVLDGKKAWKRLKKRLVAQKVITLRIDPHGRRPLCPKCGKKLFATLEMHAYGVRARWSGEDDAAYDGFDACDDDASHREWDLGRWYCAHCPWNVDPREVDVQIEEGSDG